MARVSTYLNFPRNTEEAFTFYKSVFGGDFGGMGIARFGDIPPQEGMPPLAEKDKNLIMHIELATVGGHIIMGTDAPESMGFRVNVGNNVHINLEPDTKKETKSCLTHCLPVEKSLWNSRICSGAHITEAARINMGCSGWLIVMKNNY